jgi:hypothetical protein
MKRKWLFLLLALSLAVNAGVVAVVVRERVRIWQIEGRMARDMREGRAGVKKMFKLFDDWGVVRKPIGEKYWAARAELGRLGLEPRPDSAEVEAALDRLCAADRQQLAATREFNRECWALYKPEAAAKLRARIEALSRGKPRKDSAVAPGKGEQ